jgi:hypothetical protein
MTFDLLLLNANALICVLIALRLMFYQKKRCMRSWMSVLAYFIIIAAAWIAIRILWGDITQADAAQVFLNLFLCIALLRSRGNVARADFQHKKE